MYAVIETGGKQYRVEVGTELEVELLDAEPGQAIKLDRVLLVADGDDASVGRPLVADATVEAEVVRRDRGDKVISFKYRPKARRRVKKGHRQELTVLRVTDVILGGRSAAESQRKADEDAKTERQRLEEAAARQAAADAELAARLAKRSGEASKEPAEAAPAKRTRAKAAPAAAAPAAAAPAAAETEAAAEAPVEETVPEAPQGAADEPAADAPGDAPGAATADSATTEAAADAATSESEQAPARKRTRAKKDE